VNGKATGAASADINWASITGGASDFPPVVLASPEGHVREAVVARLALDCLGSKGRVLWVSARPPESVLGLAAKDTLRLELNACSDVVAPFDALGILLADWCRHALAPGSVSDTMHVAAAVGRVLGSGIPAGGYADGLEALRAVMPQDVAERLQWRDGAHDAAADRTDVGFATGRLVTVAAGTREIVRNADGLSLLVLGFLAAAAVDASGRPVLVILEDVFDVLPEPHRRLVGGALVGHCAQGISRALLVSVDPAAWEADSAGVDMLLGAHPLVAPDFHGRWPEYWGVDAPEAVAGSPVCLVASAFDSYPGRDRPMQWRWLVARSPFEAPLPGLDLDGETVSLDSE
jgi:hypothetical protein